MKKILSITLIALLGLFIQPIVMAETTADDAESPASKESASDQEATTGKEESTENEPDENKPEEAAVEESDSDSKEEPPAKQEKEPDILGESVDLQTLRGDNDVDALSALFPNRRTMAVDGGIEVAFEEQPPVIPHGIDKTRISLQENSCLKCHSRADSKAEDAPKPPKSHFIKRDGSRTEKVSMGRYFCTQCHVPQANKKPVVKNTYKN